VMEDQAFQLLMARFDKLDSTLSDMSASFDEHVKKDEGYWLRLDQQEAQVSVFKWITSGLSGSAIIAWLYEKFGH
jgi:RNA binding exosome subunit